MGFSDPYDDGGEGICLNEATNVFATGLSKQMTSLRRGIRVRSLLATANKLSMSSTQLLKWIVWLPALLFTHGDRKKMTKTHRCRKVRTDPYGVEFV